MNVISAKENINFQDALTHKRTWVLVLIIAAGLLVTFWLFREIRLQELDKFRRGFDGNAAIRTHLIEYQLKNDLMGAETLVQLFQASELVEPHEFRAFTQPLLVRTPEMSAIAWVAAVPKEDLSRFQESANGVLHRQFRMFERKPGRNAVDPGDRGVYYPIFYIESTYPGFRDNIGFDMGTVPEILAGFEKAVMTGKTTVCRKTDVMIDGRPAVAIIVPCHRKDFRPETGGMKAWAIQGFAVAILQEDALKASLLKNMGTEDVVFALHDVSNPEYAKPIVLGSSGRYTKGSWRSSFLPSPPRFPWSFELADRTLRIEIVAGPGYMEGNYPLTFWLILPAGIMLTLLLGLYLSSMLSQKERLEYMVAERTAELMTSEEKYRQLVENANEAIFVVQDGMFRFVNTKCCEVIGYTRDELLTSPIEKYIHPEDRAMIMDRHVRRLKGEDVPHIYPFRIVNRANLVVWVEINVVVILWEGKQATLNFLSDITERKQAEEALLEHKALFARISSQVPGMLFQFARRPDGTYSVPYTNDGIYDLFGCSPEDVRNTFDPLLKFVLPEDRVKLAQSIEASSKGLLPWSCEFRIQIPGKPVRWILGNSIPEKMADGTIVWSGYDTDITERKEAEEALLKSEELYSRLVATIPDIIVQTAHDGTMLFVNDYTLELSGYTKEELLGQKMLDFLDPEDKDRALQNNFLMLESRLGPQEYNLIMKDGRKVSFEINGDILRNTDGTPFGHVLLCRDISQRKKSEQEKSQLQAQLLQAQKMESIGTLAGGIAHDFNNILSSVLGYAGLAKMKKEDGKALEDEIDQIMKAGIRARDLVKQILAFSRQSVIQKAAISIAPIIKETVKLLRASLPTTIEIRQNIAAPDSTVIADPTQMHQIIMNLFTNAAHAMKDNGGVLTVDMREVFLDRDSTAHYPGLEPGRYLRMSISDTGIGIPATIIGKIFDPFFTTKERGEGTGMGLSVVHGIVKDMGGAISVYSESRIGTTFHILLPLAGSEAAHAAEERVGLKRGSGRILFVDDEEGVLESGRGILERVGYHVIAFLSAAEALDAFRQDPAGFDLVLTDMTMPRMTGLELSERIHEVRQDIPIVLCTGFGFNIPQERMRQAGILDMVMKPMIVGELTDVVFNAMNKNP